MLHRDEDKDLIVCLEVKCLYFWSCLFFFFPQWGAADVEIKVPSDENTELKSAPFKLNPGVGQYIAMRATLTARDFFFANFYPSGPFTCIFSKTSPEFFRVSCS